MTLIDEWYDHAKVQFDFVGKEGVYNWVKMMSHAAGVGRHNPEEIEKMMEDDLSALSDLLGKHFTYNMYNLTGMATEDVEIRQDVICIGYCICKVAYAEGTRSQYFPVQMQ